MLPLVHRGVWLAGAWLLALAIAFGSLLPGPVLATVSRADKVEHVAAYLLLTLWLTGMLERRFYWVAAAIGLALGAGLELAQGALTSTRVAEARDMLANASGVAVALLAANLWLGGWAAKVEAWLARRRPPR